MPQTTASLSPQGQRGGCGIKKRGGVAAPHSLNSFVSCGLPLLFGFENDDPEKFEETIATPPQKGVPTDPDSGALWHASIPARRGSLSSVFIPAGRLGNRTDRSPTALRFGCPLFPLPGDDPCPVLAVKAAADPLPGWRPHHHEHSANRGQFFLSPGMMNRWSTFANRRQLVPEALSVPCTPDGVLKEAVSLEASVASSPNSNSVFCTIHRLMLLWSRIRSKSSCFSRRWLSPAQFPENTHSES